MLKKISIIGLCSSALIGCAKVPDAKPTHFDIYTTSLATPIPRNELDFSTTRVAYSNLSIENREHTASIGEVLFSVSRFIETKEFYEEITHAAPSTGPFPQNAEWSATHSFSDETFNNVLVYTSASYKQGQVGVLLDSEYNLVSDKPLVKVAGKDLGRRWHLYGKGQFFKLGVRTSQKNTEKPWGIRFGGVIQGQYIFEIVDKSDSSTIEILQTIQLSEKDFLEGVVIRGVLIDGSEAIKSGLIKFTAIDQKS